MRIALIGYGKMGKAIEEIALQKGHEIILKIGQSTINDFTEENLSKADVAIEFTNPHSAFGNVKKCLELGVPVVCGSTGWTEKLEELKQYCTEKKGGLIYASNFSIGVNIFFELNKKLASLMAAHPVYEVRIDEIHHTQKKDAPSGTAITLAEQVMEKIPGKKRWINGPGDDPADLMITSKRVDPAPGTHRVNYSSGIDDIEIIHTAHNRKGFAAGAVLAAEFLADKKGFFTMKEVLNL
ncbi:MAG: 4-hydroxy-tetrahydrodipicolinate reductase [Chitinophagaceae bacterium]